MAIRLIVNADDLGYCGGVNDAVAQAHAFGTLSSASLMVTGESALEAASMAKDNPGLSVGLHLALSRAKSVLSPSDIPALVDSRSCFREDPTAASFKYFFSSAARKQLAREIEAQFEAFAALGLRLSHVDGHQHLHAHPVVLPIVIKLAGQYDAPGIRVPREPLLAGLATDHSHPVSKLIDGLAHAYLTSVCRNSLIGTTLATCDYCIGGLMSGRMTDQYAISALERIASGSVELYFHPSTRPSDEPLGPNTGDLAALNSPRLREFIQTKCQLATYESLPRDSREVGK